MSEGGLEHPFEWHITETVIHHQPKLTRQGPAGPHFADEKRRQHRPARQVQECELRKRRGRSAGMGPQARAGLRQPPHYAYSSGKHGDSLPLLPGSSGTAAAASQTGPDDLAAELNPHETELNPHKAVPGG